MLSYPTAPKRPYEITQHGQTRIDNYYWMRDRSDPEVLKYLHAENDYLEEIMGHTKSLQETLYAEMKARIKETDSTIPEKRGEYFYYSRQEAGKQYPIYCRKKGSLDHPEEILLDQNGLAEGKSFCSVGALTVSPDGNKLAYSLDVEGGEVYTIYVKDLVTGTLFPEAIPNTFSSVYFHTGVEWGNDSETLFYLTLDEAERPDKVFRHRIGADPQTDRLIFHEQDESYFLFIHKTRDGKFIFTNHHATRATEMRFLAANDPESKLRLLSPRKEGIEYFAAHHEGYFYIVTNHEAENFKLMRTDLNTTIQAWEEIIPHRADVLIDYVDTFKEYLIVYERRNGLRQIRISPFSAMSNVRYIEFPEPAYSVDPENNPEFDTNILRFTYSSPITPHSVIDYHMDTGQWEVAKQHIPCGYDRAQYIAERIHANATDGKQIPMTIVYKKDLKKDGNNPTLLYGYGSYEISSDPRMRIPLLSLLERGVFLRALARRLQLRHHARVEQPRHVQIIVVVFVDLDDGGDVIGVGQQDDLRLLDGDLRQRLARRNGKGLIELEVGMRNDLEVLVEHDRGGKSAHRSLESQELAQFLLVVLEYRLGAREVEGHHHDVGAHDLGVIAQIGLRGSANSRSPSACAWRTACRARGRGSRSPRSPPRSPAPPR